MVEQSTKEGLGDFVCSMPTRVIFGMGKTDSVGEEAKILGSHALLVAAADSMEKIGALGTVRESLARSGVKISIFQDVQPNPTVGSIDEVAGYCRGERCDFVVGLGGGSSIDFAKGVAIAATHSGSVWDYVGRRDYEPKPVTDKALPIVAISTTAGTGSEVTQVAVITNPDTKQKPGILSPYIFPKVAVVDPGLTLSLPPRLTASTGFDAFSHALEAFVSKFTTPFADMLALEALRLVANNLPLAVNETNNKEARERMAWAATLGGLAIGHAGMTVVHGIVQALGGRFDMGHGDAVALCLPEVMERPWEARVDRFARVAEVMGISDQTMSARESAEACIKGIKELRKAVGLDIRLAHLGIHPSPADIEELVSEHVFGYLSWAVDCHPRELSSDDVKEMIQVCL